MSLTALEETRLQNIESSINKIQAALKNVSSKRQLTQLLAVLQKDNADLKARIEALESAVSVLKANR